MISRSFLKFFKIATLFGIALIFCYMYSIQTVEKQASRRSKRKMPVEEVSWLERTNRKAEESRREKCRIVIEKSKVYKDNRRCHPIAASSLLRDYGNPEIGGRIMKSSETPRKLISFLEHPRDVTLVPSQCHHLIDKIKWKVVFFVKSSATNYERRSSIRETWGAVKVYRSALIKVVFIVGTVQLQTRLNQEIKDFKDILLIDMEESSRIVPEKVLAGMQWSSEHLSSEWIYASLDDDVVVMMPNLVLYLESLFEPAENNSAVTMSPCYEDLPIVCVYSYQPHDVPARDPKVKWFISKVDYPDQKWPVHCRGGLYLMSNKLASDIFSVSRTTPRLHLDDVWITGLMRRKLNYGDCNIIAAPFSRQSDFQLQRSKSADKEDLVKHLWGNIQGKPVAVFSKLKEEWLTWKEKILWDDHC